MTQQSTPMGNRVLRREAEEGVVALARVGCCMGGFNGGFWACFLVGGGVDFGVFGYV